MIEVPNGPSLRSDLNHDYMTCDMYRGVLTLREPDLITHTLLLCPHTPRCLGILSGQLEWSYM